MRTTHDQVFQELASKMVRDRPRFLEQLREVEERYPEVMLAYRIQQAVIRELSMPASLGDTEIGRLYATVERLQVGDNTQLKVENQERLQRLERCLERAHTSDSSSGQQYSAGVDCFREFLEG